MDNTVIKDVLLDKKLDSYGFDKTDFLAAGELTVTITLGEYRKLVKDVATAQARIDKAEADRYDRNRENERLTEENNRLKAELYEMQKASEAGSNCEESTEWKSELASLRFIQTNIAFGLWKHTRAKEKTESRGNRRQRKSQDIQGRCHNCMTVSLDTSSALPKRQLLRNC